MHPIRRRKLIIVLVIVGLIALVASLVLYALRQNISLFYSPTQVMRGEAPPDRIIRIGGMVVEGSVRRGRDPLNIYFKLTDYHDTISVKYHGILPDLFREKQGIVTLGQLNNRTFQAKEVLAKHDENYMPREVRDSLHHAG